LLPGEKVMRCGQGSQSGSKLPHSTAAPTRSRQLTLECGGLPPLFHPASSPSPANGDHFSSGCTGLAPSHSHLGSPPLFRLWIGRENRTQARTNLRQRKILEKYLSQNATRLSALSLPDFPNSCINEIRKTAYIVSSKTNEKDRSDGQGKRLLRAGHHVKHR
jgi:hypothetical protein